MLYRTLTFIAVFILALQGASALARQELPHGAVVPKRSHCQVSPLSDDAFSSLQGRARAMMATPEPFLRLEDVDDPLEASELAEADLPAGLPADAETIAAITVLELEFAACRNAGELRRAASLLTGDEQIHFVSYADLPELSGNRFDVATPMPKDMRIPYVIVSGVRMFSDGRAGAVVDWGSERNFGLYELIEGRWLVTGEIRLYDVY